MGAEKTLPTKTQALTIRKTFDHSALLKFSNKYITMPSAPILSLEEKSVFTILS